MKSKQSYHLMETVQNQLRSVHYWTESQHYTFERYLESVKAVWQDSETYGRLPRHRQAYVRGYHEFWYKALTAEMPYVHEFDGRVYLSWDSLPEAGRERIRNSATSGQAESAHVWPITKEGKPLTDGELVGNLHLWGEFKA